MAFALSVWLAVQEEFLGYEDEPVKPYASPVHPAVLPIQPDAPSRTLLDELDDQSLFESFHLTRPCISFLLDLLERQIDRVRQPEHTAEGMILLALNFYAMGTVSADLLVKTGVRSLDSSGVIALVSKHLSDMADQLIALPETRKDQGDLAAVNKRSCGIPRVLGVLGTAHFRTQDHSEVFRSPLFLNTHGYTSVVCQVVCDLAGYLLNVERCQIGSKPNHELWMSSSIKLKDSIAPEFWLVVGRGYEQSPNLLPAFSKPVNQHQASFNAAQGRARAVLSCTLGRLKQRFRVLQLLGSVDERLDGKQRVIEACCVLHNLANQFSVPAASGTARDLQHPAKTSWFPQERIGVNRSRLLLDRLQLLADFSPPPGGHAAMATESEEEDPSTTH
ncbi:phosphatidylinositol N-acetylglucosaminyltransferase subunit P isoform X1 [Gadus macrocephalus]|uniref:phosphatidylinositol N-acetylglucosaminyltransferase subunit P isoform X1 n=1 Tax=Gadus macrocephalus TaxID=80720 RepID=UPI0028CB1EB1|nr:phosphatidylinositol N-acetylglucosaminyltransferase subunit P isoform X1 [Gadus macrocephalus]